MANAGQVGVALIPDLPSYTILAQMHRDLSEWVHPHLSRWIVLLREAARFTVVSRTGFIRGQPSGQQLKKLEMRVPPLLGHALGAMAARQVPDTLLRCKKKR